MRNSTPPLATQPVEKRGLALFLLVSALASAAGLSFALAPTPTAPHDRPGGEFDVAAYWLPRHRAVVEARRGAYPVAQLPSHLPARLRFGQGKRVSSDILGAIPANLLTAQAETQTEPYVAVNPENPDHLVAGWQENRFTDGGARSLGVAVSTNAGKRWADALLPGLAVADTGPWDRASDPWPTFGPGGIVYYASLLVSGTTLDNAIAVSVSEDGGVTWGAPVEVTRSNPDFNDKEAVVADTRTAGRHRGNVYVGWDVNLSRGGVFTAQRMVIARSTDNGKSWGKLVQLAEGAVNIGIVPRVGPDGTVYAIWAGAVAGDAKLSIFFSKSTNGGRRFSPPVKIAAMLGIGVAGFRSGTILPSFDLDPTTGDLYAVWADARFTGVDQAAMIVSRDGGDSWSVPARANDGPAQVGVMTVGVAVNGAGEVAVGYYTLRNDTGAGTFVDYYVNRSRDGGRRFERGVRATRKTFDASTAARAGQALNIFLGDYVGLAGSDDGFYTLFTAVTKRSRLGPGRQPDIFAAASR